ncbi:phage tail protein [Cohnella thailandensis]|uniref:Phage tail protein n=1 Tax=Cohnella thailandensis TaxID=557557 RepID=A0A841SX72_9BACL|nr:tail fiber protein [Cohnella thailandensis]MBB6634755.1 phage tail protein [Cohnella thailandensis]MBP1977893.1 microcystin-dependent protein [Cohnella thailandensis]
MSDQYLGEIRMFSGAYAPQDWAFCNGQLLPINGNDALFTLIGTQYGGDGKTNFALPDLRGRVPLHEGKADSGTVYPLGRTGGTEQVTLNEGQLPAHTHSVHAQALAGSSASPANNYWATSTIKEYSNEAPNGSMSGLAVSYVGGNAAHNNMMPFFPVTFIIALKGIFPSYG